MFSFIKSVLVVELVMTIVFFYCVPRPHLAKTLQWYSNRFDEYWTQFGTALDLIVPSETSKEESRAPGSMRKREMM